MLRTVLTLLSSVVFLHVAAAEQGMRASTVVYDAGRLDSAGNEPVLSSSFLCFTTDECTTTSKLLVKW